MAPNLFALVRLVCFPSRARSSVDKRQKSQSHTDPPHAMAPAKREKKERQFRVCSENISIKMSRDKSMTYFQSMMINSAGRGCAGKERPTAARNNTKGNEEERGGLYYQILMIGRKGPKGFSFVHTLTHCFIQGTTWK